MAQPESSDQSFSSQASEDDERAEQFSAVLATLKTEMLPRIAMAALQLVQPYNTATETVIPSVGEPMYGSYHVLFPLDFKDGPRWVVKFPINGTPGKWDELSASALASEVNTMRLLKRETTIPLPDVLDFSPTTQNALGCPYIIMSFVPGIPLYNVWFGHRLGDTSPEVTRERRIRALESIASAMVQMGKYSFSHGGQLVYGINGRPSGVEDMRRVDTQAMLDRWFVHQDPDDDPIYVKCKPTSDPRSFYTTMLEVQPERTPFVEGLTRLLRQLISWIPQPVGLEPFVLAHPDFDIQNFIVSEDGDIMGIIDWDGVASVPRTLGNERYPGWLTRDLDPVMYGYKESMEDGVEPEGVWEDSPESLTYYRGVYDGFMTKHRADARRGSDVNLCRMSLIIENLAIAADDPQCRNAILRKMLCEIWTASGQGEQPELTDLANMFFENKVDTEAMETLRKGFEALLVKEGL